MEELCSARKWFIHTALVHLGAPYIWGGDDPSGFDCSGLVVECLKSAGLLNEDEGYTAYNLWRLYSNCRVDKPYEGCLLFHFDQQGRAVHVVVCLDPYFQIGAGGGSRATVTVDDSRRQNAFVKIRPIRLSPGRCAVVDPFKKHDLPAKSGRS